jgi:uncharacterized protein (TIGR04255 family)
MSINQLFPYAGDHAIQSVAFALEWNQQPLTAAELQDIRTLHPELIKALPIVNETRMLTINTENQQVQSFSPSAGELSGVHFNKPGPAGGIARSLQVSRGSCIAIINDYTRWNNVWADVQEWFNLVTEMVLKGRSISSISIQYTDVFNWRADPDTIVLKDILQTGSKYLPSNIFSAKSLWHAHHGYFETILEPVECQILENINVSLVDNGQRSISILTVHKANLVKPIWDKSELQGVLIPLMQNLHERNKLVLKDLLTDGVQAKIKLSAVAS